MHAWHPIRTNNAYIRHEPHQPNCNPKHMHQHLMSWLDSYSGHAESAVQLFIRHTIHYIPSLGYARSELRYRRPESKYIAYHPHIPRDTHNPWPSWPQGLYKRIEISQIRHSEHHHHQVHPVSPDKKNVSLSTVASRTNRKKHLSRTSWGVLELHAPHLWHPCSVGSSTSSGSHQSFPSSHQELLVLQWLHPHTRQWWLGKRLWKIQRLCLWETLKEWLMHLELFPVARNLNVM